MLINNHVITAMVTHAHVNRAVTVFCRRLYFRLQVLFVMEYKNINRMDVPFTHVRHRVTADVRMMLLPDGYMANPFCYSH